MSNTREKNEGSVRLSLLSMLIDEHPDRSHDGTESLRQQVLRLEESVRQDLQALLNTRQLVSAWPRRLELVWNSLVDYGVPDLSGADLASSDLQAEFREELARSIRKHEPRLQAVKISSIEGHDQYDRTLRIKIEATLRAESGPREKDFEFELEPVSRQFR